VLGPSQIVRLTKDNASNHKNYCYNESNPLLEFTLRQFKFISYIYRKIFKIVFNIKRGSSVNVVTRHRLDVEKSDIGFHPASYQMVTGRYSLRDRWVIEGVKLTLTRPPP
jgi:hypothetical protein